MNRFVWLMTAVFVSASFPAFADGPAESRLEQSAKALCGKEAVKSKAACSVCPPPFEKSKGRLVVKGVTELESQDGEFVWTVHTTGCTALAATVVLAKSGSDWVPIGEPIVGECSAPHGVLRCSADDGFVSADINVKAGTVVLSSSPVGTGLANVGSIERERVGKLSIGAVDVEGALDKNVVSRVVRQHWRELKYCYESQLVKNPKLTGLVNVRFVVSATGTVVNAQIQKGTLNNKAVEECIGGKIRRWMFPVPTDGQTVTVELSFAFSSNEPTQGRTGTGYGKGAGNLGDNKGVVPRIVPGKPVVKGPLDENVVSRVGRQHRRELKYCYEAGLNKNPGLKGQVVVKFLITETGRVSKTAVKSSTLKNKEVESCITNKLRGWVFPEPKGGKQVTVNFPFDFST